MAEPDVTMTCVESFASAEAVDLQLHVTGLHSCSFIHVLAAPSGLHPDMFLEHVLPCSPASQPPLQRI